MEEKAQPKISLPEIILIGLFLAILDAIDLIPFAGDLTDVFAAPLIFYYFVKNINGIAYAISLILDAIPAVQEIPTRSIVWWITVAFDHFAPKPLEEAVEKVGELGEGAAAEEAAAAEETEAITKETVEQGEKNQSSLSDEQEGEDRKAKGKPSEESGNDFDDLTDRAGGDENEDKDEDEDQDEDSGDIMVGSEISPSKEAEQTDFDLPEENLYDENRHK